MLYAITWLLSAAGGIWLAAVVVCSIGALQHVRRWLLRIPAWLVIVVARYPAAPIAVWLFSSASRRVLTRCCWLETIDNDLSGDAGWRSEHLIGSDPLSYINRVRWLWRNGGNRFNYGRLGCWYQTPLPTAWPACGPYYWQRPDGYWLYRRYVPWIGGRKLDLYVGWALTGPQLGRCKFVCQLRNKKHL